MDVIGDSGRSTSRNIIDIIQKAIFSVLHDWEIKTRTRIKDDARGTVEYVSFDIGYGIKEDAIKEGSIVFAGPVDQRLVVKIETNYYEHIEAAAPEIFLTCEREHKTWMEDLCIRIDEWMLRNNYFRGKKIKPDGKGVSPNNIIF